LILFEGGLDPWQEVLDDELLVGGAAGPGDFEGEFVAALEPEGDLFDGGLFEIVGYRGLAGAGGGAG
jgi:hypothetical protein